MTTESATDRATNDRDSDAPLGVLVGPVDERQPQHDDEHLDQEAREIHAPESRNSTPTKGSVLLVVVPEA